jgi:hypothetical protein
MFRLQRITQKDIGPLLFGLKFGPRCSYKGEFVRASSAVRVSSERFVRQTSFRKSSMCELFIIDYNSKEVPINTIIKYRTYYYQSRKPRIRGNIIIASTLFQIQVQHFNDVKRFHKCRNTIISPNSTCALVQGNRFWIFPTQSFEQPMYYVWAR